MTDLFGNKYRIKSTRLPERDYRNMWAYFVTFNIKDRRELFGHIRNGEMVLSDVGKICNEEILYTATLRDNVSIDTYIVMPDHVNIILMITEKIMKPIDRNISKIPGNQWWGDTSNQTVETPRDNAYIKSKSDNQNVSNQWWGNVSNHTVQMPRGASLHDWWSHHWFTKNMFGPQSPWSLAVIINQMKWTITRRIRKTHPAIWFPRQPRYYERIIRTEEELQKTRQYIFDNPKRIEDLSGD